MFKVSAALLSKPVCRPAKYGTLFLLILTTFNTRAQTPDTAMRNAIHAKITGLVEQQSKVKYISQAVISHDGNLVAWAADGPQGNSTHGIYFAPVNNPAKVIRVSALAADKYAYETEPQFSPDGSRIAFLSDAVDGQNQVFIAGTHTGAPTIAKKLTVFDGFVSHLKWSPDGKYISVLYVEKASREPSPMAATGRAVGLIDSILNRDVQRIAIVNAATGETTQASPEGLWLLSASSSFFTS
ncbi:MAG: hypothetical protein EOO63_11860 [Hymenobacter sp.]|nr:MAG: hypothetical protein EOO63_11860 [Hymenobacter sp.]